jgi:hypothetical protein
VSLGSRLLGVGESRVSSRKSATYAAPHNGLAVLTSLRQYTLILLAETFAASERAPRFTDFLNLAAPGHKYNTVFTTCTHVT